LPATVAQISFPETTLNSDTGVPPISTLVTIGSLKFFPLVRDAAAEACDGRSLELRVHEVTSGSRDEERIRGGRHDEKQTSHSNGREQPRVADERQRSLSPQVVHPGSDASGGPHHP
jgi:hypothetical protein